MKYDYGAHRKTEIFVEESVSMPLCPPDVPHGRTMDLTRSMGFETIYLDQADAFKKVLYVTHTSLYRPTF